MQLQHTITYARRLQTTAILPALIAAGAYFSIPLGPVPIVLQNMFVILAGLLLPPLWSAASISVYLLLGVIGLPVYAGGTGGIAHFAGPTGGYLIGFLPAAAGTSVLLRLLSPKPFHSVKETHPAALIISLLSGFLLVYVFGIPWLAFTLEISLLQALPIGFFPFLFPDLLKAAVLYIFVRTIPVSVWRSLS